MQTQTQYQRAKEVLTLYGVSTHPSLELVRIVHETPDLCVIMTERSRIERRARETRVISKGARTVKLNRTPQGWVVAQDETIWFDLPEPTILPDFAVTRTLARVAADRIAYEMCARPGAASWTGGASSRMGQRDSYGRTRQGYNNKKPPVNPAYVTRAYIEGERRATIAASVEAEIEARRIIEGK